MLSLPFRRKYHVNIVCYIDFDLIADNWHCCPKTGIGFDQRPTKDAFKPLEVWDFKQENRAETALVSNMIRNPNPVWIRIGQVA